MIFMFLTNNIKYWKCKLHAFKKKSQFWDKWKINPYKFSVIEDAYHHLWHKGLAPLHKICPTEFFYYW